jgi:L-serine dehydratase
MFLPFPCEIRWDYEKKDLTHPNTLELYAYSNGKQTDFARVFSIGGGDIQFEGDDPQETPLCYPHHTFAEISEYCVSNNLRLWQYVRQFEDNSFEDYMLHIWDTMKSSIRAGLNDDGVLPGGLDVPKKAKHLYSLNRFDKMTETKEFRLVSAYAFAVSEQNACGKTVVTAPTCGSAGVVPAVLYYQQQKHGFDDYKIARALAAGGIIGNLIKTNATISGAEGGCQAEIGTACAMAAAALAELLNLSVHHIEYAAEVAIEHHLGLTCDPIEGLVQIPCIERNAVAAIRAINAVSISSALCDYRKISLDNAIRVMRETGKDICHLYRETSQGGLAKISLS